MKLNNILIHVFILLIGFAGFAHSQEPVDPIDNLNWQKGPTTVLVGSNAQMNLPSGYRFLDAGESKKFMELTQNLSSGDEYVLAPDDFSWWTVFTFSDVGYVKDDEKLDSVELLSSIKSGTEAGNEERKSRGWSTMTVTGWRYEPRYDKSTQLLEWAFSAVNDSDKVPIINYNTRLLGRKGVMEVVLVADPENLDFAVSNFKGAIKGFRFNAGETYAEYQEGDHVAEYGLAALVAGGAAAVATKKGLWPLLLAFFAKGWKLIILGFLGIGALIKKFFGRDKESQR